MSTALAATASAASTATTTPALLSATATATTSTSNTSSTTTTTITAATTTTTIPIKSVSGLLGVSPEKAEVTGRMPSNLVEQQQQQQSVSVVSHHLVDINGNEKSVSSNSQASSVGVLQKNLKAKVEPKFQTEKHEITSNEEKPIQDPSVGGESKQTQTAAAHTFPRPPGGYKYSIEFLYSIGSTMAGMTLNIPTPASITPRSMRTTPPPQPLAHLPLLQNTMAMGMNMGMAMGGVSPRPLRSGGTPPDNRFVGGGSSAAGGLNTGTSSPGNSNVSPTQYIYPGYIPSGPQRRLWHGDNAVWQFDRNYPYNQGYSSQYGFPMMPMGFEHAYGGQRFVYPGYYNQATSPTTSRGSRHPSPNSLSTSPTVNGNQQQQQQQQSPQQQQQSPQQHSENDREMPQTEAVSEQSNHTGNGNGHHVPPWRPHSFDRTSTSGSRDHYGMGGRQQSAPGHTASKSFYNSGLLNDANGSGVRFKQSFDQRSGQQRSNQQSTVTSNGNTNTSDQTQSLNTNNCSSSSYQSNSNNANNNNNSSNNSNNNNNNNGNMNNNNNSKVNNSYQPSDFKPRGRERQSIKRGKYNLQGKETNSNSSGSLSTSSSKSQLDRRADGASSNTSLSPHKHRQRSYRNRFRYGPAPEVERKSQTPTYQPHIANNRVPKYPSSSFQQTATMDYMKQQNRQHSRYYQSRHMDGYGYQPVGPHHHHHHHHYMMYSVQGHVNMGTDGNGNPLMDSNATPEGEQPLDMDFHNHHFAMDVQNGVYHPNAYKQDISDMDNCCQLSQDSSLCGGLEIDDGQSYASLMASSDSGDSESELSDTSVESLVRHITVDCLAKAMSAQLPDLNGPNLVPYGDMQNLKELERKSQMALSNGYKCINTPSTLNCCGDMLNVVFPVELEEDHKAQPSVSEDADDDSSEASALSCSPSACSSKSTMGSVAVAAKANIIMDESPDSDLPIIMHNRYWREFFGYTPADRFLLRAKLIEMKRPPRTVPSRAKWDHLSLGIWHKFVDAQQTCQLYKTKMRLWRSIYSVTMDTYPRYGLYLVGSSISYFGSKCSDMDICMLACTNPNIDPRMEAVYHLQLMRELLSSTDMFQDFNLIEARVPILRFTDRRHKVEVDINFNNSVGIRNTHLLYCYSQLEWRVRPIALTVKQWAQYHNINNAKNMTISSYSLMLMVIHYLQAGVSPPVLPCLHKLYPEKFGLLQPNDFGYVDMNEIIGPYQSDNRQPLGELLLGFLHYYSVFEYSKYVISIRVGGVLPVDVCRSSKAAKNDIHQWNELCIEEPFDQTNTARSVYDPITFDRIRTIFLASYRRLESTRNLSSIFEHYDGPTIGMQPTAGDSEHDFDGHYVKLSSRSGSTNELLIPSPKESIHMLEKASTLVWRETTGDEQKSSLLLEKDTTSGSIEKSVSGNTNTTNNTTTNTTTILTTTTTTNTTTTTTDSDTTETTNIIDTTTNTITTDNIPATTTSITTGTTKNQLADDHVASVPPLA